MVHVTSLQIHVQECQELKERKYKEITALEVEINNLTDEINNTSTVIERETEIRNEILVRIAEDLILTLHKFNRLDSNILAHIGRAFMLDTKKMCEDNGIIYNV